MAPSKTGLDQVKAEFRQRKGVGKSGKGGKVNLTKKKIVNILSENCVQVRDLRASGKETSQCDCQAVESVNLVGQQESLGVVSVEEQILKILGEISDDESDSSFSSEDLSPDISKSRYRYPDIDFFALGDHRKQKIIELFGDDDLEIDATRRWGFPRAWQLTGIDVEVQHRRSNNLGSFSEELLECLNTAKQLFSVDPFQLSDFETVWNSFVDEEVSGEISCYRPTRYM